MEVFKNAYIAHSCLFTLQAFININIKQYLCNFTFLELSIQSFKVTLISVQKFSLTVHHSNTVTKLKPLYYTDKDVDKYMDAFIHLSSLKELCYYDVIPCAFHFAQGFRNSTYKCCSSFSFQTYLHMYSHVIAAKNLFADSHPLITVACIL